MGATYRAKKSRGQAYESIFCKVCGVDNAAYNREWRRTIEDAAGGARLGAPVGVAVPSGCELDQTRRPLEATERAVWLFRAVRIFASRGTADREAIIAGLTTIAADTDPPSATECGVEIMQMAALSGPDFADAVLLLDAVGWLEVILPEVHALKGMPHDPEWHPEGDVFEHTIAAIRSHDGDDPLVNLALLLHDVGKAVTHRTVEGRHDYLGHAAKGAEIVESIVTRFGLDQEQAGTAVFAARNHMRAARISEIPSGIARSLLAAPWWPLLAKVVDCDWNARECRNSASM